jgi:hypothetical protein
LKPFSLRRNPDTITLKVDSQEGLKQPPCQISASMTFTIGVDSQEGLKPQLAAPLGQVAFLPYVDSQEGLKRV